jgi:hypothetical protein
MRPLIEDCTIAVIGGLVLGLIVLFNMRTGEEVAAIFLVLFWIISITVLMDYITASRRRKMLQKKIEMARLKNGGYSRTDN